MRNGCARNGCALKSLFDLYANVLEEYVPPCGLRYAEGFSAEAKNGLSQGTWEAAGYRIQKPCPHMKTDLTRFAVIEDGILTYRLHNWQYELATGRCLTSEGHQLYYKPIEQGAMEA
jgi:hypothetical protein